MRYNYPGILMPQAENRRCVGDAQRRWRSVAFGENVRRYIRYSSAHTGCKGKLSRSPPLLACILPNSVL